MIWIRVVEEVSRSHGLVMFGCMVLAVVVGAIGFAFAPVFFELALSDTVADPVEAHIDGFGSFLFHSVHGNTSCRAVVSDNGSRWLSVSEFFKDDSDWGSFFSVVEEGTEFGFGSARHDFA